MRKVAFFGLFLVSLSSFAKVWFESPSINGENQILYTVRSSSYGTPSYSTAFKSDATFKSPTEILTCFPEKLSLVAEGTILQINNRYGIAQYFTDSGKLRWVSNASEIPSEAGRIGPFAISPDGKWLCYVRKVGGSTGNLILRNNETLEEKIVIEKADFSYEGLPVKWAKDGTAFVYENDGNIYFCEPKSAFEHVQLTEKYRKIGWGNLNSVFWCGDRTLLYVDKDLVYKINSKELFTRGLYAPLVGIGEVCARLPISFDFTTDRFWANDSLSSIVIVQSNSIVSSFKILDGSNSYVETKYSAPFTDIRGNVLNYNVFWDARGEAILWVNVLGLEDASKRCSVYRISNELKLLMSMGDVGEPFLSPDGTKLAFAASTTLFVYDLLSWRNVARLNGEKMISCVWKDDLTIYAGGESTVREWKLNKANGTEKVLFLSSAKDINWILDENANETVQIIANTPSYNKKYFKYEKATNTWSEKKMDPLFFIPTATVQNGRYRVFAGNTGNPRFENALYIRNLVGKAITTPVFPETVVKMPARKKVALIFDATESADGLPKILNTLKEFGVSGTFFLNGEFIRRYPTESKQIKSSGYECASLFFTNVDLTSNGFVIDNEFIIRGLARNEDEFFTATKEELSLFWHAPYYNATESMKKASQAAGYTYIDAKKLSFDTVTFEDMVKSPVSYLTAGQIIDKIVATAEDKSVIPVSVGLSRGKRGEYLYEKLDLLITALLEEGFEIVPLRDVIN